MPSYRYFLQIVGLGREVQLSDKKSLPYIEATIMEIQRLSNIGKFIPKRMRLINFRRKSPPLFVIVGKVLL